MINLNEIYSKIKFATILTTGRTGSDYLQACLDNVPGILTFSGHFRYYNFYDNLKFDKFKEKKPLEILDIFIEKNNNLLISDERENKTINLDIQKFKENFEKICKQLTFNRQKFLFAIYLAYHQTLDRKIESIHTMVHHSHSIEETRRFLEDFKKSSLLVTIRDPRANLKSGILNWISYDKRRESQYYFYFYIRRVRED